MPQFINSNISSLTAQRNLNTSQNDLNTSLQRLSSGLRINSAKDDAAGLAISERFTSQIRGLNQAIRNANDGVSLAQTAEGALGANSGSLQRIRELAIQSANSTNSSSDRKALNNEAAQLLAEVQRVGQTTQFNGQNILDGTFSSAQFQVGANANQTISFGIAGATTSLLGSYQVSGATAVSATALTGGAAGLTLNGITVGASVATNSNGVTAGSAAAKSTAINAIASQTGVTATASTTLTGASPVAPKALTNGALLVNGVAIGSVASGTTGASQGSNAATAINALTSQHGVTAAANATTGALTLTASDGRDITLSVAAGTATVQNQAATDILNATGLDAGTGTNSTSHQVETTTLKAGVTYDAAAAGNDDEIQNGSTFSFDGITYEFTTTGGGFSSGDTLVNGNTAVAMADNANITAIGDAIEAAVTQVNTDGRTTFAASNTTGTITFTNEAFGLEKGGFAATALLAADADVLSHADNTTDGTDSVYTAESVTGGTISLNSAENFTIAGSELAAVGLASATTGLTQLGTVDISTVAGANNAISILDGALSQISTIRSGLGAIQNRFDSTIANLSTTSENLSAARSRIQDADFAAETAALTRAQILQQAGTSILAQANQLPQNVLSLLQ